MQGAWIEMYSGQEMTAENSMSLPVQGAWIEIIGSSVPPMLSARRSPCRERGLKFCLVAHGIRVKVSLPVQGAWIEMPAHR